MWLKSRNQLRGFWVSFDVCQWQKSSSVESGETEMATKIEDMLRFELQARFKRTGTKVSFPVIHVLIESLPDNSYIATCLEYSQSYDGDSMQDAVSGLIDFMFRYFDRVLAKGGAEALYDQVRRPDSDALWARVREFYARKRDAEMNFVHRTYDEALSDEQIEELAKALPTERAVGAQAENEADPSTGLLHRQQIVIESQQELIELQETLIESILKTLHATQKERARLMHGLEGAEEWEPEISSVRVGAPFSVTDKNIN